MGDLSQRLLTRFGAVEEQRIERRRREKEQALRRVSMAGLVVSQTIKLKARARENHVQATAEHPRSLSLATTAKFLSRLKRLEANAQHKAKIDSAWEKRGRNTSTNPLIDRVLDEYLQRESNNSIHSVGGLMKSSTAAKLEGVQLHPGRAQVLDPTFELRARRLLGATASRSSEGTGSGRAASSYYLTAAQLSERKQWARARLRKAGMASLVAAEVAYFGKRAAARTQRPTAASPESSVAKTATPRPEKLAMSFRRQQQAPGEGSKRVTAHPSQNDAPTQLAAEATKCSSAPSPKMKRAGTLHPLSPKALKAGIIAKVSPPLARWNASVNLQRRHVRNGLVLAPLLPPQ